MRHRHLTEQTNPWSIVAIDSILEHGGASDVIELLCEIQRDPGGEAARNALISAEHTQAYGHRHLIPALVPALIRAKTP